MIISHALCPYAHWQANLRLSTLPSTWLHSATTLTLVQLSLIRCVFTNTASDKMLSPCSCLRVYALKGLANRADLLAPPPNQWPHLLAAAKYLSFYHIVSLQISCCDLSVREKDWRSRAHGAKAT
jgi:hypothetical protein